MIHKTETKDIKGEWIEFIYSLQANNIEGSKFPCKVILLPVNSRAVCGLTHQSIPMPDALLSLKSFKAYQVPFGNRITGASSFNASAICSKYGCAYILKSEGLNEPGMH